MEIAIPLDPETERLVSAALLRLRMRAPFFATLALFARVEASEEVDSAATDGRNVFLNPGVFQALGTPQQDHLLLHQVLHAALLHVTRRGGRDPRIWNTACDIVVKARFGVGLRCSALRLNECIVGTRYIVSLRCIHCKAMSVSLKPCLTA